jgi:diadenosine tetraphosphatase ApaH/serine/threonine PP2A family protein phosphatase
MPASGCTNHASFLNHDSPKNIDILSSILVYLPNIFTMKTLIISDIHANITALESVLADAGDFDSVWALGDVVGYGPDPNECVERVRDLPNVVCLLGNHDAATIGMIDDITFNPAARMAVRWTKTTLTPENLAFLDRLPEYLRLGDITLAHGSPREPVWEYLLDTRNATENFSYFYTPYCLVGHTHLPTIYTLLNGYHQARLIAPTNDTELELVPRSIINPGSVGQPRDRDPRAAYAILDLDTMKISFHRVPYDIKAVQERMQGAGLPNRHVMRLTEGW